MSVHENNSLLLFILPSDSILCRRESVRKWRRYLQAGQQPLLQPNTALKWGQKEVPVRPGVHHEGAGMVNVWLRRKVVI